VPEFTPCNLCGADATRLLFQLRDYRLRTDDVMWTAVQCECCGLGYLNPRPTAAEVSRYYPPAYFSGRAGQTLRYRRQTRYLPRRPARLLDVGTARGDFLSLARDLGWSVEGIELAEAAGNPHELTIHRLSFPEEATSLPAESYDVITAWAVFEHLRDPRRAFEVCGRLLRPDGRLIVQVPNLRSISARFALQEDVPRHLYFFSPATLRRFGQLAGLEFRGVDHTTDLFGGSGRGVLRLAMVRALGGTVDDFFAVWRTPRRERFRRWPLLAAAWTAVAAVERVVLGDWLVRTLGISGQIVVEFHKPARAGSGDPQPQIS
jgi:SAM-dependent methyltransferase